MVVNGHFIRKGIQLKGIQLNGGQNLERRNVEQAIFRSSKIANIKITKDELFDSFIFEFNF